MGEVVAVTAPRRRTYVRYSAELAREVCRRVASGEALSAVCAEPGMPTHGTVARWAKVMPRFGRVFRRCREAAGWSHPRGRQAGWRSGWGEAVAAEIFARLCDGESLKSICEDPRMPGHSTVHRWRHEWPEFGEAMTLARQVQAEQFVEKGWEIAEAVTAETAYATRVKLEQLRWTAGVLAPKRFGRFKAVTSEIEDLADAAEAAAAAPPAVTKVVFTARHFELEELPDGTKRVVALERCPETGRLMREKEYRPFREG